MVVVKTTAVLEMVGTCPRNVKIQLEATENTGREKIPIKIISSNFSWKFTPAGSHMGNIYREESKCLGFVTVLFYLFIFSPTTLPFQDNSV